jgi:uncharacterized damage-inducible protein DinB
MTNREFYLERQQAESHAFMRVLKALPVDHLDYRPHERSPTAKEIVWLLTGELRIGLDAVINNRAEWIILPPPAMSEMLEKFETWSWELIDRVSKMSELSWDRVARFYFHGTLALEQPVGTFLWLNLFEAIHHRGQLSAYLHAMGAGVPTIYAPTANEAALPN